MMSLFWFFVLFDPPSPFSPSLSDRIDKSEKDLAEQQKKHRDEIMKIQETAKQLQQAAVQKQAQATQQLAGGEQ